MDVFRAEVRIVMAGGILVGALMAAVGLVACGALTLALGPGPSEQWLLLVPMGWSAGAWFAFDGVWRLWRCLKGDVAANLQRGLSRLTLGLTVGSLPGVLFIVGVLKALVSGAGVFDWSILGLAVLWLVPLVMAIYAGVLGMRLRIAMRGFERA